jgi:phage terminase large subunit
VEIAVVEDDEPEENKDETLLQTRQASEIIEDEEPKQQDDSTPSNTTTTTTAVDVWYRGSCIHRVEDINRLDPHILKPWYIDGTNLVLNKIVFTTFL